MLQQLCLVELQATAVFPTPPIVRLLRDAEALADRADSLALSKANSCFPQNPMICPIFYSFRAIVSSPPSRLE
jgi:hypothetical protein